MPHWVSPAPSSDCSLESSFGAISSLKCRATSCFTASARACGSAAFWSPGAWWQWPLEPCKPYNSLLLRAFCLALPKPAFSRVWQLAAALFWFDIGMYVMRFYMPQVVKALSNGLASAVVGVLVMVPHLAGLAAMVLVSRSSGRRLERRYHSAIPIAVAGI